MVIGRSISFENNLVWHIGKFRHHKDFNSRVVSPLFSSMRQIWQMASLIGTLPVCLNDKKRVEQNGKHEGCFPRRLEYVLELLIPIYTGVCTHSFVYIGRNN